MIVLPLGSTGVTVPVDPDDPDEPDELVGNPGILSEVISLKKQDGVGFVVRNV